MAARARSRQGGSRRQEPDPAILDLEHLRRYTIDNPGLERELIGLFLKQLPSLAEQLRNAAGPEEWRFATHTLKGSARVVGATGIAEVAAALEAAGMDADAAAIAALDKAVAAFIRTAELLGG